MRMLKDAKDKKFDLIVTREVSRFARNTVDTLQKTRTLKTYGVEVWFTEDNIWTLNDEDGELRLSIMATLAQNESKKISQRVKAGQMISFKNGVFYGNGNILGYDRVGDQLVVNPEQADTVKRIFELYLAGNGVVRFRTSWSRKGVRQRQGLLDGSPAMLTESYKILFIVAESYTESSMFLIIWFRRKSIIMEQLIRCMWKVHMKYWFHRRTLIEHRS